MWNTYHHPDDVEPAIEQSLKDLGLDYVDLYLMHWPIAFSRQTKDRGVRASTLGPGTKSRQTMTTIRATPTTAATKRTISDTVSWTVYGYDISGLVREKACLMGFALATIAPMPTATLFRVH